MTTAPELSAAEAAKVAEFDAAPDAFRETSIDQLTARDLGFCVVIPDREVVGYLYVVRDDFNDGYPSRSLVLVSGNGQATYEEVFTDSDPAGYPKTMTTPCKVEAAS